MGTLKELYEKALSIIDDNLGVSEDYIITNRFATAHFIVESMQEYANQEVEKALKERDELDKMYKDLEGSDLNKPFFGCKCTYPSCNRLSNCRNKNP